MAGFTEYSREKLLGFLFKNIPFTPKTLYVGLLTSTYAEGGDASEVTGASYARVPVEFSEWDLSDSTISNLVDILFPAPTEAWGDVVAVGIFDAATEGNLIAWGPLPRQKAITTESVPKILSGELWITLL